ncbi:L-serine ammonia-lyase [Methylobacterium goesingense]|uniref:L-serine dehydratase n=1 Tax=Methylobacterium goesingense TaxID=243690 RepID=A0ABV2KZF8_9HYPH|nr:L-serine ammonia-lyase [Methylobacterium goesingense]GJD71877.1 L-serine dehydratase 2 [Methylobacterium goesingense]
MFLSVFDVFKPGIGPSSSHTMGPMTAAADFLDLLRAHPDRDAAAAIRVSLHGSLAFTGKGHATDRAVALGLLGFRPADVEMDAAEGGLAELRVRKRLAPPGLPELAFDPMTGIVFDFGPALPGHANGLVVTALDAERVPVLSETYYSIGGGFIVTAAQRAAAEPPPSEGADPRLWPYPFDTAVTMLRMARESGLSIAAMKRANEVVDRSEAEFDQGLARIWGVMNGCIERGLAHEGELPGGLRVKRRAKHIRDQLVSERGSNTAQPHAVSDWLSVYAMAVNEENAAGGKVVTAPTNGAAGVVPAVIRYYLDHCVGADPARVPDFLLTAAAIGGLIKHNASISGAEAGCQGEVGSASAMAAAGLCAVLGGTPAQVENAAEIALEHHLGMTCDPVAGLVQVPCIERNGIGATKAVAAASLALRGDGSHFMPLDNCIAAMRQTGEEMSHKYKETSLAGLAVNLPEC